MSVDALKSQSARLKILLTNDDGIDGEGLLVLAKALQTVSDVYILAPDGNRSAVSNHIIMHKPLRLTRRGERIWTSEGNPVDCVITALRSDLFDVEFDGVVSGINKGANMGTDIVYSGTAAAARQAVLYGKPGIAVSLESDNGAWNYLPLAQFVAQHLADLLSLCTKDAFVNINAVSADSYAGVAYASLCVRDYQDSVNITTEPDGQVYAYFSGGHIHTTGAEDSDYAVTKTGKIAVSRILAEPSSIRIDKMTKNVIM